MAHHKSAKKRIRSDERKRVFNKTYLSSVRTAIKKLEAACEKKENKESVANLFVSAQGYLARAAKKGIMHKNTASRKISRLNALAKRATA